MILFQGSLCYLGTVCQQEKILLKQNRLKILEKHIRFQARRMGYYKNHRYRCHLRHQDNNQIRLALFNKIKVRMKEMTKTKVGLLLHIIRLDSSNYVHPCFHHDLIKH